MPIEVPLVTFPISFSYERVGEDVVFRPADNLWESCLQGRYKLDAFAIRELFLQIRTPEEALDFLSATGIFRSEGEVPVRWSELQLWQELIRLRMTEATLDPSPLRDSPTGTLGRKWPDLPPHFLPILRDLSDDEQSRLSGIWDTYTIEARPSKSDPNRMELYAYVDGTTTLEAMLSVVNIDHLQGINYSLCKRNGCKNVFEVTRPDKEYCSQACAHKVSVYRNRHRNKGKKAASAKKATR